MNIQLSGKKWEYRNSLAKVGDLIPVACYTKSISDTTPIETSEIRENGGGHVWTGFVEVMGWDEIPDEEYYNGIRRELRVKGPVVNRKRSVIIDGAPNFVRVVD